MREADLPACEDVGDAVHLAHPEDEGRMAEKFRLYPAGCLVLRREAEVMGYAIAFPGRSGTALSLNAPLGWLPAGADALYVHDLALLPASRGIGAGRAGVEHLAAIARGAGFGTVSLVAVAGTTGFWERSGFQVVIVPGLAGVLGTYGPTAAYMERFVEGSRVASKADCSM